VDWGGYGRGLVQGTIEGAIGGAVGAGVALGGARMVAASFGTSALGTTATAVVSGFAGGFAGDQSGQLAAMAVGVQAPAEYSVSRSVYAGAFGAGVAAGVGIVGAARQAWAARGPNSAVLRSSSKLNSVERARPELLDTIRAKGRIIKIVQEGSEEARYLDFIGAEANVGGESMTHILLRQNPGKAAVLEEFLHGTQYRLGIIERLGTGGAERHVKDFMIRHRKLLGLGDQDVDILRQLMEAGL
jgi:hypothetical protein